MCLVSNEKKEFILSIANLIFVFIEMHCTHIVRPVYSDMPRSVYRGCLVWGLFALRKTIHTESALKVASAKQVSI